MTMFHVLAISYLLTLQHRADMSFRSSAPKKSRPGWDLKGRLADMEEAMHHQQSESGSLRLLLEQLQKQNVALESTAQEKTQILEADRVRLADVEGKYL